MSTLGDTVKFIQSFLPGGPALLKADTIDLMCRNQLASDLCVRFPNKPAFTSKGFGLGSSVTIGTSELEQAEVVGEVGWGGFAGNICGALRVAEGGGQQLDRGVCVGQRGRFGRDHDQQFVGQREREQHHIRNTGAGVEQNEVKVRPHRVHHLDQPVVQLGRHARVLQQPGPSQQHREAARRWLQRIGELGATAEHIVQRADQQLYRAKAEGRDRCCLEQPAAGSVSRQEREMLLGGPMIQDLP